MNEDFGDTVPSKPHQVPNGVPVVGGTVKAGGLEEAGEGDFGSVIIHGGVNLDKSATKTPVPTTTKLPLASVPGQNLSMTDPGEDSLSPWYSSHYRSPEVPKWAVHAFLVIGQNEYFVLKPVMYHNCNFFIHN